MAETNYDLKLVVDADTSEAQRKLDALGGGTSATDPASAQSAPSPAAEAAAQEVRRARAGLGAGGSSGSATPAPRPPQHKTVWTPEEFAAEQKRRRMASSIAEIKNGKQGAMPDEFGRKAGESAGRIIGKSLGMFVAGFAARQISGIAFESMKTPGGDNRTVNKAEAAVGGSIQYGMMGAFLGGPLGAAIGAVAGLGIGYANERVRQKKEVEAEENATRISDFARKRDSAIDAADTAFSRSLDLSGGRRQRLDMMRARREEIANGSGTTSIRSLEGFLKGADPNDRNTIELKGILEAQKSRVASLDQQILQEGLAVAPARLEPGDVGDAWSKRGIGIGATVDVSQVNEKIMGEVQSCRALLEKIANMGTDNLRDINAMQRAVYE